MIAEGNLFVLIICSVFIRVICRQKNYNRSLIIKQKHPASLQGAFMSLAKSFYPNNPPFLNSLTPSPILNPL